MKIFVLFSIIGCAHGFTQSLSRPSTTALNMNVENVDSKRQIKVGVIGMGRIGLVHLEAITKAPGVTPVIVSNPTVSKAEAGKLQIVVFRCRHGKFGFPLKLRVLLCLKLKSLFNSC